MEENEVKEEKVEQQSEVNSTTIVNENTNQNTNQTQYITKGINVCGLLSFIFSIIGIFVAALPCGIIAVILGIIGTASFKPEKNIAKWLGITGLVLGAIEVALMIMAIYLVGSAISGFMSGF